MILLLACSDHVLTTRQPEVLGDEPDIVVTPLALDFWSVGSGEAPSLPVTVSNIGVTTLEVDTPRIEGSGSFSTLAEAFDLAADTSATIDVVFTPVAPDDQAADLVLASNDLDTPEIRVPLTGSGRVPLLQITPELQDFGVLPPGCADTLTLTLQNVGNEDLIVDAATSDLPVTLDLPFTLTPYAYVQAELTFSPTEEGAVTNTLSVTSNDPRGVVTAVQTGEGGPSDVRTETFPVEPDPPVDLLFAVDRSGSMDDDAAALAANFASFISLIEARTQGWHLGVVTLDDGALNGGVLDTDTVGLTSIFAEAVVTGDDRELLYDEALFQLVDQALDNPSNAGFLRDGALLHVVVITDEPERSTEQASAWTWPWYLDRWLGYVASDDLLRVSGIIDLDGCGEGDAVYTDAIAATGGEALSICTSDWADDVATLADASLDRLWSFTLAEAPVSGSVVVTIDGVATTAWALDEARNVVTVDGLAGGETVAVSYTVAQPCP